MCVAVFCFSVLLTPPHGQPHDDIGRFGPWTCIYIGKISCERSESGPERRRGRGGGYGGGGKGNYIPIAEMALIAAHLNARVTTRITTALRWAAMRAILMFQ